MSLNIVYKLQRNHRLVNLAIAMNDAASNGDIDTMKQLRSQGYSWNSFTWANAARNGQLETLKWMNCQMSPDESEVSYLCPWDKWTCAEAAFNGHLHVLQWMRSQTPPCPWDEYTCAFAAVNGHLHILKWLRSQTPPCPWTDWTCSNAINHAHMEVLRWVLEHGCPFETYNRCIEFEPRRHYDAICWLIQYKGLVMDADIHVWIQAIDEQINQLSLPLSLPLDLIRLIKQYI